MSACVSVMHESAKQWGVNTEQGLALHKAFQDAGLPKPRMCLEMVLGGDQDFTRWVYDALCSKKPVIEKLDLSFERLGDRIRFKTGSMQKLRHRTRSCRGSR